MKQRHFHKNQKVLKYLTLCDLPIHTVKTMSTVIDGWIFNHGLEWTISHLKAIKNQLLKQRSGDVNYRSIGVSSRKDGTPKGVFSSVWALDIGRACRILNVYTLFRHNKLTKHQIDTVIASIKNSSKVSSWWDFKPVILPVNEIDITTEVVNSLDPLYWITSNTRRCLVYRHGGLKTVPESDIPVEDFIREAVISTGNKHFVIRHSELIFSLFNVPKKAQRIVSHLGANCVPNTAFFPVISGKISFIQERGGKLRHVANPLRLFQALCSPFASFMDHVLRTDDLNHCIYNQEKGLSYAIEMQGKGVKLFSVDLSKATDRFPLSIQLKGLEELLVCNGIYIRPPPSGKTGREHRSLFIKSVADSPFQGGVLDSIDFQDRLRFLLSSYEPQYPPESPKGMVERSFIAWLELSTSHWYNQDIGFLSWNAGQPLGLFPSFFSFTFVHVMVLRSCCLDLDIPFHNFMILGDDVLIANERLYDRYRDVLSQWDVPISEDKTFESDKLCEFAGKLIYDANIVDLNTKFQDFSKENPFGPLVIFGIEGLEFVPKHKRSLVKRLASLPEPFGLGLNPKGIPLEYRMRPVLDKMGPFKREPIKYSSSSARRSKMRMYQRFLDRKGSDLGEFIKFRQELDPRLVREYNALIKLFSSWDEEVPPMLKIKFPNMPNRDKKPDFGVQSSGLALLSRFNDSLKLSLNEWETLGHSDLITLD